MNIVDVNSPTVGTVHIQFSQIGFTGESGFALFDQGTVTPGSDVIFRPYYDAGNNILNEQDLIGGPILDVGGQFSDRVSSGLVSGDGPYSLTEDVFFGSEYPNVEGEFSGDFSLDTVPEPSSVILLLTMLLAIAFGARRELPTTSKSGHWNRAGSTYRHLSESTVLKVSPS